MYCVCANMVQARSAWYKYVCTHTVLCTCAARAAIDSSIFYYVFIHRTHLYVHHTQLESRASPRLQHTASHAHITQVYTCIYIRVYRCYVLVQGTCTSYDVQGTLYEVQGTSYIVHRTSRATQHIIYIILVHSSSTCIICRPIYL